MKLLLLLLSLLCLFQEVAPALPLYSITDLGDFPGGPDQSQAAAINNAGQVVGFGQNASRSRAFLSATNLDGSSALVDLGELPRLPSTGAQAINALGQIVGSSRDDDKSRSFLWNPTTPNNTNGTMLEVLGLPGDHNSSRAMGINERGQIAGFSVGHAYLWTPASANGATGTAVDLGGLSGGLNYSLAFGINDLGQVIGTSDTDAGQHAFLWTPTTPNNSSGSMVDLGTLPGGSGFSEGTAINAAGAVVGLSDTATAQHGFLWKPATSNGNAGTMIDLGELEGGNDFSFASAINSANQVVGYSNSAGSDHAFWWSLGAGMVDLNSLTDQTGGAWILRFAQGINDRGQITGWGEFDPDGAGDISPATHAFRADRVAEVIADHLYPRAETPGVIAFYFVGDRGVNYQLEGADNLSGPWSSSGDPVVGNGGLIAFRRASENQHFFWRILALQ